MARRAGWVGLGIALSVVATRPDPLEAQGAIAPPREGGVQRPRTVAAPGAGEPGERESVEERRKRLEAAGGGVTPTPAPPVLTPTPWSALAGTLKGDVHEISASGKDSDNSLLKMQAKASLDLASWWHYRHPKDADYLHDFSWGTDVLLAISGDSLPENGGYVWSAAVGPRAVFYNCGVYVRSPDPWGRTSSVYADSAITELGGVAAGALERRFGGDQTFGIGFRGGYLPLRWVRARHYSLGDPKGKSDASSHFGVSLPGMEADVSINYGFARLVEIGLFTSFEGAWPWQIRGRAGLRLSLLSR